ncbi:MAG: PIN domain-containing protein [Clostridiales bacterium]|nr:PIN domain-containing protein [Clostridiales bacterium]
MRVLLDTNVIIDVLQKRQPWFSDAKKIFYAIANKKCVGCITAKEAADIYYFSRKQFSGEDNIDAKVRQVMMNLYSVLELIDTLSVDCQNAMAIENSDYEDAIMIASATRAGVDCIVTRNPNHFTVAPLPVMSPAEFAERLK